MSVLAFEQDDFGFHEWWRLSSIAMTFEPKMRRAYTRAMRDGTKVDSLELRQVITSILARVCRTSAPIYGLVFNPNSPIYIQTIDRLVERYVGVVDSPMAREEVKRILPNDLPLHERKDRLNTFGLDAQSAVRVERFRQEQGNNPQGRLLTSRLRSDAIRQRGNLLALTETSRAINQSLESLWLDNMRGTVSKAAPDITYLDDRSTLDLGNLPKRAKKEIVTRRDDKVCNYCEPLDGITARVGENYDTDYGLFEGPPFHPRCRCFQIISVSGRF